MIFTSNSARKRSTHVSGFTVLELLITIAIIAVISSVIIAATASSRERALESRARSEMKQIINAIILGQANRSAPLVRFAPSADYTENVCGSPTNNPSLAQSAGCTSRMTTVFTEIQAATNGVYTDLVTKFQKDPWGNPWAFDANQGSGGSSACGYTDTFRPYKGSIPNMPTIPLSPNCP
jgi:prepilin-type N-terminal cleavage/methylation domain-containing protein